MKPSKKKKNNNKTPEATSWRPTSHAHTHTHEHAGKSEKWEEKITNEGRNNNNNNNNNDDDDDDDKKKRKTGPPPQKWPQQSHRSINPPSRWINESEPPKIQMKKKISSPSLKTVPSLIFDGEDEQKLGTKLGKRRPLGDWETIEKRIFIWWCNPFRHGSSHYPEPRCELRSLFIFICLSFFFFKQFWCR